MTTYVTPYAGYARTEVEVELVSQSGNTSTVRYRVYVDRSSTFSAFVQWNVSVGDGYATGLQSNFAAGRYLVKNWTTVTVTHSTSGIGSAQVEAGARMLHSTNLVSPQVAFPWKYGSWAFGLPPINRLPDAPGIPSVSIDLREIVAEPGVASPNGAAPVLEYEMQMQVGGVGWFTVQVGARKAVLTTYEYGVLGFAVAFRARARSVAGWGDWSPVRSLTAPRLLGVRHTEGEDIVCQQAERYLGDGAWTPVYVTERFDGTNWVNSA